jgi:SAM-dependent methyltransferase
MGTAQVQGELWGVQVENWANVQEKFGLPIYKIVFERTNVSSGTRLLDVGCGTGLATQLAAKLGAQVTGIDASAPSIDVARERVPKGDFQVGELQELPFEDATFDVVTGFNAFQFAENPVAALQEARRVMKRGGQVAMVTWGRAQDCEAAVTLAAVMALLPPPPPGAEGPFALSEPGRMEALLEQAGLAPGGSGDIAVPMEYPDAETAWRGWSSSGPLVSAVCYAGESAVKQAVLNSLEPYKTASGGYRQQNSFRYAIAIA